MRRSTSVWMSRRSNGLICARRGTANGANGGYGMDPLFNNFDKDGAIGYAPGITKYSFLDNMKLKMSLENRLTWTPYLVGERIRKHV